MTHVNVTVNGTQHEADVEPRTLLVYFLREQLGLTGTAVGPSLAGAPQPARGSMKDGKGTPGPLVGKPRSGLATHRTAT